MLNQLAQQQGKTVPALIERLMQDLLGTFAPSAQPQQP